MMKILVFSDSHGSEQGMVDAIRENQDVQMIIFLGDGERDFESTLSQLGIAPYGSDGSVRTLQVCGNCDRYSMSPVTLTADLAGVKTMITHGHDQNVKYGYARLTIEAKEKGCCLVLFGHTHKQYMHEKDGLTLLNPGSIRSGKYAVICINDGKMEVELKQD